MADTKLSALTALTSLLATDTVYIVRSGVSYKTTVADLRAVVGNVLGSVANYAALPVTLGDPAIGGRYIVEDDQGSYFTFNKKPAGLYERTANNGVSADWTRLGDFTLIPHRDDQAFYDDSDGTKTLKFQLSGITTATERVATWPDKDGTVAMVADIAATKLDDFASPEDNTDLNASTTAHGLSPKATAPAAGQLNVHAIANGETARTDKALFDSTDPAALGTAASGTSTVAARRDHVHTLPKLDDLAAPEDNTDLDATTSGHGLMPKLDKVKLDSLAKYSASDEETDTYTLVLGDAGMWKRCNKSTAFTVTIPPQSSVTWVADTEIFFEQVAAGQITIAAGSGVTLNNAGATAKTRAQYSVLGVKRVAEDVWTLFGDTAAS